MHSFQFYTLNKNCPVYKTAGIIGKKWSLLIILELYRGTSKIKRYKDIKSKIPEISPKLLSIRLKELEKNKMILKKIDSSSFPIKTMYSLTESGVEFIKIIKDIKKWSFKWKSQSIECRDLDCKKCRF